MRSLKRNQSVVYYKEYGGKVPIFDDEGNETNESEPIYGSVKTLYAHKSKPNGEVHREIFGTIEGYDVVLGPIDDLTLPIDEHTIFWVDNLDGEHDYVVKYVHRGLNQLFIAVKKVR